MSKRNKYKKSWGNFENNNDRFIIIMDDEPCCSIETKKSSKYMKRPTIRSIEVVWALGFKVKR